MIGIDKDGNRFFRGRLYRDDAAVTRVAADLDDQTAGCLARAFDEIERGEMPVVPFFQIGWYRAKSCGFWIFISVEPGEEWADVVLLREASI